MSGKKALCKCLKQGQEDRAESGWKKESSFQKKDRSERDVTLAETDEKSSDRGFPENLSSMGAAPDFKGQKRYEIPTPYVKNGIHTVDFN